MRLIMKKIEGSCGCGPCGPQSHSVSLSEIVLLYCFFFTFTQHASTPSLIDFSLCFFPLPPPTISKTPLTKEKENPKMQNMPSYLKIKKLVADEEADFVEDEEEEEEDAREEQRGVEVKFVDSQLKKKKLSLGEGSGRSGGGVVVAPPCCLVENCEADLSGCKKYHQRHRVCEVHAKAPVVLVDGLRQRFCQQCSRFHEVSEFDQTKRSCRRRLAGHNERRRKSSLESNNGSNRRLKENQFRQHNETSEVIGSPVTQNFHIHTNH